MSIKNPYRAAGTFSGPSYVERAADRELMKLIDENRYYAYFLAPRQQGKSSLIRHTMTKLEDADLKCVFVDLSAFHYDCKKSYDKFLDALFRRIFRSLEISDVERYDDLLETFFSIEKSVPKRIVIFLDEVDWLRNTEFKDIFLSNIRAIYNARPGDDTSKCIQFILSGAVPSTLLISNQHVSPFNVATPIELLDLSLDELRILAKPFDSFKSGMSEKIANKLKQHTNGSVYLSQLILDTFWERTVVRSNDIDVEAIDGICNQIVLNAKDEVHFRNIEQMIAPNPDILKEAQDYLIGEKRYKDVDPTLLMVGLFRENGAFRNSIYNRVFGINGSLALFENSGVTKKIHISYSHSDRVVAQKLRKSLLEDGYDVWIAEENLRGSVMWTQTILDAIDSSDGLVLVWSSSAKESLVALEEVRIARVFRKPIFPVKAYPEEGAPPLPRVIRSLQTIADNDFELTVQELKRRLADPSRNRISYKYVLEKGFIPKNPNPYFVGREKELKDLFVESIGFHRENKIGIPIAISGLAGIGKSQLALIFAYRFNSFFSDGVYWVDTPKGIVQEFERIGGYLQIRKLSEERPLEYANRVYEKLNQLSRGLIIFDNVTDIAEFRKWCPVGNLSCSVILTTRKSPRGFAVRVMNLPELDVETAYELIVSRRKDRDKILQDDRQREALKTICRMMGNHPLALELCASYLQDEFVQPADFLDELEGDPITHLSNNPEFREFLVEGEANLLEVLRRNYESLDRKIVDPYFLLMCCFAPHGISPEMIVNAYGDTKNGNKALSELAVYSLIYREQDRIDLHPLVSRFGKSLQKKDRAYYQEKFVEVILGFLHEYRDNLSSEKVRTEFAHISDAIKISYELGLWSQAAQLQELGAEIVDGIDSKIDMLKGALQVIGDHLSDLHWKMPHLLVSLGKAFRTKGQPREALIEFNNAEALYSRFLEIDPKYKASLQFEFGDVYMALGQYEEAGQRLTRAQNIALVEASFHETAPEVTQIDQALARRELFLGHYEVAEKKFKKILNHRLEFHSIISSFETIKDVSSSLADLSQLALERGNYNEALTYAEEALTKLVDFEKDSGPEYGAVLLLIGDIHFQSGEYKLAEEQLEGCRQTFLFTYGERHPSYARALIKLADLYRKQGKFSDALKEIERALAILEDRYGTSHAFIVEALEVQGKTYNHQGAFDEEELVWKRIIGSKVYPENHPALATTYSNYAHLYLRRGEFSKAVEKLQTSLKITEKSLGKMHSHYFGRVIRLASCYFEQQKFEEAQKTLDQAKHLRGEIFSGSYHPYIARMYQLQSEIHRRTGEFDEALKSIDEAIDMKEEIYGEQHPSVAEALGVKVKAYHSLSEILETEILIKRALKIRKDSYGENHSAVVDSEHDLGLYYLRLGQYNNAIIQFEKSRKVTGSIFGERHLEYIERTLNLVDALCEKGAYDASFSIAMELKEVIEERVTTKNHHLKALWLYQMADLQRRKGFFEKAMVYIADAIDMLEKLYSKTHPSLAQVLEIKVDILLVQFRTSEAEDLLGRIETIRRDAYGVEHPAYGDYLMRLAEYHSKLSNFDEANRILLRSLGVYKSKFSSEHPGIIKRRVKLAKLARIVGDIWTAEKQISEANESLEGEGHNEDSLIASLVQRELANIHYKKSYFEGAIKRINKAYDIAYPILGPRSPSVIMLLIDKAKLLVVSDRLEEAEQLIQDALNNTKTEEQVYKQLKARALEQRGLLENSKKEFKQAAKTIDKAIELLCEVTGENSVDLAKLYVDKAGVLRKIGDYNEAINYLDLAQNINNPHFNANHLCFARILMENGWIQFEKKNFLAAKNKLEEALELYKSRPDQELRERANAAEVLGLVYISIGDRKEAYRHIKDALEIKKNIFDENHPELTKTLDYMKQLDLES